MHYVFKLRHFIQNYFVFLFPQNDNQLLIMEIASKYNPVEVEDKWYQYWLRNKYFHSEPDNREPFTIVIPPPNVTGVLHMGAYA